MGVGRAPAWVGCNTRVAHPVLLCSPKCGTRRVRPCFVCLCFRPLPICVCICVPCRLCLLALPSRSAGVSSPLLSWGLFRSCASSPVPSLRTSDELAHSIPLPLSVSPHRTGLSVESWLDPARTLVMVASTRCRCVCVCVCVFVCVCACVQLYLMVWMLSPVICCYCFCWGNIPEGLVPLWQGRHGNKTQDARFAFRGKCSRRMERSM